MTAANLVEESASNPGTGNVSLLGNASGKKTFASQFADGATPYYFISDGTQAEAGRGTLVYGTPNVLQRTSVLWNSAGTAPTKLNFTGAVRVYCQVPASMLAFVLGTGGLSVDAVALGIPYYGGTGGGTANAQTATLAPAITALSAGLRLRYKPNLTNTSAGPTLAVNGLTAKTVKCRDGSTDLPAGCLPTSGYAELEYDGTNFRLMSPDPYAMIHCGTSGGTANAQTLTPNQPIGGYYAGLTVRFIAGASNTGATTLNLSSLGTKTVKTPTGLDVTNGHIVSGQIYSAVYDGTNFVLANMGLAPATLIEARAFSAVSAADFPLPTAYRKFTLHLQGIVPATNAAILSLRTSTDSGSTFASSASNYAWQVHYGSGSTTAAASNTGTALQLTGALTNSAARCKARVAIDPGGASQFPSFEWTAAFVDNVPANWFLGGYGERSANGLVNYLRVLASSGNITGVAWLEGYV